MFFDIPYIKNNYLKLSIPVSEYEKKVSKIDRKILDNISTDLIFILISSILFAFYVLKPLKKAYEINETFIKDILHDFNTPISSIQVNLYALKRNPNPKYIKRIENSINAIIKLQENLKSFLNTSPGNKEKFDLYEIIEEELEIYKNLYPYINHYNFAKKTYLCTNKQAFRSIISNILSNAFKYNKKNGYVKIYLKNDNLIIEDSGIGVKNPEKIFDRFYKENQRGIGIGMNIVKKLCDELNISIKLTSKPNIGTTVTLNMSKIKTAT
jgi:signal transduction histidine kinase